MKFVKNCRSCGSNVCITKPAILAPFLVKRIFDMEPESTTSLYGLPNQTNYFPCKTNMCEICGFVGVNILFDEEEMNNLYFNYRGSKSLGSIYKKKIKITLLVIICLFKSKNKRNNQYVIQV